LTTFIRIASLEASSYQRFSPTSICGWAACSFDRRSCNREPDVAKSFLSIHAQASLSVFDDVHLKKGAAVEGIAIHVPEYISRDRDGKPYQYKKGNATPSTGVREE
jgi:hypothetical protein